MDFLLRITLVSSLLILPHIAVAIGCNDTYEFGNDCPILARDVTEDDEIYVEYNGKEVVSHCTKFKFRGMGEGGLLDESSICVTPLDFNDKTCAVEVDVVSSFSEVTTKKITCNTEIKRYKYCGIRYDTLTIVFKNIHGRSANDASFRLLVTATKRRDGPVDFGILIIPLLILVTGSLALLSSCTSKFCLCVCRRNLANGRVIILEPRNQTSGSTYVVYPGQLDLSRMTTTVLLSPPGVYPLGSNPQQEGAADTHSAANQWTDAPPKYEDLSDFLTLSPQTV